MTYLIQDNIAHFYNREDVDIIDIPNCTVLHTNLSWIELVCNKVVDKVIHTPFRLNEDFRR